MKILEKLLAHFGYHFQKSSQAYLPWPTSFSTVDIAVVSKDKSRVLLGRKPGKDYWVFPGGFTDPSSNSDEDDAVRELREETGIVIDKNSLKYIGNYNIDDLQYENTPHKIRTHFYMILRNDSEFMKAGDDLEEVDWFSLEYLVGTRTIISPRHQELFQQLCKKLGKS
jgi:bifunctional NMN adenylyltransferase/nudix hydrolase